jgi:hypothetical protein
MDTSNIFEKRHDKDHLRNNSNSSGNSNSTPMKSSRSNGHDQGRTDWEYNIGTITTSLHLPTYKFWRWENKTLGISI